MTLVLDITLSEGVNQYKNQLVQIFSDPTSLNVAISYDFWSIGIILDINMIVLVYWKLSCNLLVHFHILNSLV